MNRKDSVLKIFRDHQDLMDARIKSGIESYRKGSAHLIFVDGEKKPVNGVHVKLRQKTHDFKYGANLFMLEEFESKEQNDEYKKRFKELFNIATLPFYWKDLEPEQGKLRFAKDSPKIYRRPAPDLCLEFCEANGIEPKAHCLNYATTQPAWAKGTVEWEKKCLSQRFRQLAERYASRIPMWEVTNETLWWGYTFPSTFYQQPDFVEWSFKEAERWFPANKLVINETHSRVWGDNFFRDRSQYFMQIERALARGARIDEIGMQFHMFFKREVETQETTPMYNPRIMYELMDCYAGLNLPMHITEATIPAYSCEPEDEELQAELLRNVYSIWFSHPAMTGIIYWNLIDGFAASATKGDMTKGENYYYGGFLRYDFTPKPSYYLVRDLFQKEWHTELEKDSGDDANIVPFRGFYGKYDLEITTKAGTFVKEIHLNKAMDSNITITL